MNTNKRRDEIHAFSGNLMLPVAGVTTAVGVISFIETVITEYINFGVSALTFVVLGILQIVLTVTHLRTAPRPEPTAPATAPEASSDVRR